MAKTELKTDAANLALRAAAIVGVIYGIGFLVMPYSMLQLSGDPGVPTNSGWVRWAGGFVLGIAIGPWLASEGWVKEQPFIAGLAAAYTLSGLALLYSVERAARRGSFGCQLSSWPCSPRQCGGSQPSNRRPLWVSLRHRWGVRGGLLRAVWTYHAEVADFRLVRIPDVR